ncbi:MAG: hypothetical protein GKC04_09175 [Methanomicrobiales archaeon]|nr:hypothetical protein [Methanomicrobiales archaeon]
MQDAIEAAFEAGIKLGALYHQWVGTPISPQTAPTVEQAIERAVALQPCVESVRVRIDTSLMAPNAFGYSELSGSMFDVAITTRVRGTACSAQLKFEDGYPMMRIVSCHEAP